VGGNILLAAYRAMLPESVRAFINKFRPGTPERLLSRILSWHEGRAGSEQFEKELAWLRLHGLAYFPYSFADARSRSAAIVTRDAECGLLYVHHQGRRMYFPANMDVERARAYYTQIAVEQDPASPHRYLTPAFQPEEGDIIADVGAAEGLLCLECIERASHCYLFEPDMQWIEPLQRTFRQWPGKVTIVGSFVSGHDGLGIQSIDSYFRGRKVDFLKVDAEGEEPHILAGARDCLSRRIRRAVICSYHASGHFTELSGILAEAGYQVSASDGWILFLQDPSQAPPFFRRALIRAERRSAG
jgi:hypothetical protein